MLRYEKKSYELNHIRIYQRKTTQLGGGGDVPVKPEYNLREIGELKPTSSRLTIYITVSDKEWKRHHKVTLKVKFCIISYTTQDISTARCLWNTEYEKPHTQYTRQQRKINQGT